MSETSQWRHLNTHGAPTMVDVGAKPETYRTARAAALVRMHPSTLAAIRDHKVPKGAVLDTARLAGIMAAKKTDELIPLCHPLPLEAVDLRFEFAGPDTIRIESEVRVHARTGVEMEALVAVSMAALTIYDMCKSLDRGMSIEWVRLEEKTGGTRGDYRRDSGPAASSPQG